MDFNELLNSVTPEAYENLRKAVELGKWPDGRKLTTEQRELSIQAVIAYESNNLPEEERSWYIPPKVQKEPCSSKEHKHDHLEEQPVKWK